MMRCCAILATSTPNIAQSQVSKIKPLNSGILISKLPLVAPRLYSGKRSESYADARAKPSSREKSPESLAGIGSHMKLGIAPLHRTCCGVQDLAQIRITRSRAIYIHLHDTRFNKSLADALRQSGSLLRSAGRNHLTHSKYKNLIGHLPFCVKILSPLSVRLHLRIAGSAAYIALIDDGRPQHPAIVHSNTFMRRMEANRGSLTEPVREHIILILLMLVLAVDTLNQLQTPRHALNPPWATTRAHSIHPFPGYSFISVLSGRHGR
ncbi:uncharacterized protein BDR25DRAFT_350293 [Lindgomyces ingoldianus]|uniref:Uncharacterized protein n=1 Tax=Lindgomyces ingoldianus TaxID=673940 RepID=A0ACB6R9U5_9PLEO|nr:uncharacterized protein BDR25DRAFT_350293 [Lindgomyces ingoldianus]KAF2476019.1 hypothetical protein BDR25DRAFT_350293 [Lindgomyces ingoldianus]